MAKQTTMATIERYYARYNTAADAFTAACEELRLDSEVVFDLIEKQDGHPGYLLEELTKRRRRSLTYFEHRDARRTLAAWDKLMCAQADLERAIARRRTQAEQKAA